MASRAIITITAAVASAADRSVSTSALDLWHSPAAARRDTSGRRSDGE
jgi:hypothetical protein